MLRIPVSIRLYKIYVICSVDMVAGAIQLLLLPHYGAAASISELGVSI
jgi:hypothetical protein